MEIGKKRKLKFPCLLGVNDETPEGRTIQSWSPSKRENVSESDIPSQKSTEFFSGESEMIRVPSRITFGLNDRLTHSLSNMSEASLISEATNKKRSVSKEQTLGEMLYSEPLNQRERLKEKFDHGDDITSSKMSLLFQCGTEFGNYIPESESSQKPTHSYIENDAASSVDAVAGSYIEIMSSELSSQEPLNAKSGGTTPLRLSGPTKDLSSRFNHFPRHDAQLQDLRQQLHLLIVESLSTSTHTQIRDQQSSVTAPELVTWESSFTAHILQSSDDYETALDAIHQPRDPRLYCRIENCFFQGAVLSKYEKHFLYDYIEQTFIKVSKSMVANWSVNPEKGESQLMLSELSIEDQVVKVVEEIDKEDTKIFLVNNYNKNPEWLEKNQINNLGKLLSELVLTDLILEVISS